MSDFVASVGARVRMIHSDTSQGVVVGPIKPGAGADGTDRVPVKWDRTGTVTEWNPGFLRPTDSLAQDDPDELRLGNTIVRRRRVMIDANGVTLVVPGGFSRAED